MIVRLKVQHVLYKSKDNYRISGHANAGTLASAYRLEDDGVNTWGKILNGGYKGYWTCLHPQHYVELSALEQLAMEAE